MGSAVGAGVVWRLVEKTELDAEGAQMDAVRSLLPRFEAKSNASSTAWGHGTAATE